MDYTSWLIKEGCLEVYTKLALGWDDIPFDYYPDCDAPRIEQCSRIREEYADRLEKPHPRTGPPSFLEFFVSSLDALSTMMYIDKERISEGLLMNLGVDYYMDAISSPTVIAEAALESAERVISRSYSKDGRGGLFPVYGEDTLTMPLFVQMAKWANWYDSR